MKILLVNYRYFVSGGPERYMFGFKKIFENRNHVVIPFSVSYNKNEKTNYDRYFVSPIGNKSNIYFSEYRLSTKVIFQILDRQFYSFEAKRKIKRIIKDTKPDVAYILQFYNKLSPSVIDGCREMGVPTIVRISDFGLLCPNALFLRENNVCEKCLGGNLFHAAKYRCVKKSFVGSLLKVLAMYFHRMLKIFNKVDAFIVPSRFTIAKMIIGGFSEEKLYHVPSFADEINYEIGDVPHKDYVLYFGRISREKGVITLIKAYELIRTEVNNGELWIVGSSNDNEEKVLKDFVSTHNIPGIKFLGPKSGLSLFRLVKNAQCIVVPVIWYENMPNVILESFSLSQPVIASRIGGIPELVRDGETGLLFEPGNADDLAKKMQWMMKHPKERREMGRRTRELVEKEYTPEKHYEQLMAVYKIALKQHGKNNEYRKNIKWNAQL
jgi:glycosyltransferase involved in cell wall biosynthesis